MQVRFFERKPFSFLWRIRRLRNYIDNNSTALAAALDFIDGNGYRCAYARRDVPGMKLSEVNFDERTIVLGYGKATSPRQVFTVAASQIKRISQVTRVPALFGWDRLGAALHTALKTNVYALGNHYELPTPADAVLLHAACEFDAHAFGHTAGMEAAHFLDRSKKTLPRLKISQTDISAIHDKACAASADSRLLISATFDALMDTVCMAHEARKKFGRLPEITFKAIQDYEVANATSPLWPRIRCHSPMAGSGEDSSLGLLREKISRHGFLQPFSAGTKRLLTPQLVPA